MSPLNKTTLPGPRFGMRPPMPRFGHLPNPGMQIRMPPPMPMSPMMDPRRMPGMPRPRPMMRPGLMPRPGGPPMYLPRGRGGPPMMSPMMGPRGMGMRPPMRLGPRGMLPPQVLPHMRPRFPPVNGTMKSKANNTKKAIKLEELELKKPWMTDEICCEIQKKNKLYAKAKKHKDAKEWEEFKDLRNKVTRMIRDAKNEFLAKNPDQAHLDENGGALDECNDLAEEMTFMDSEEEEKEEEESFYCDICDRDFTSEESLQEHIKGHQICKIDGCTFTAHPKIVEKHIAMQHATGLYDRLKKYNDGDTDKWIIERKKKYPTAKQVAFREAEQVEKRKRGEIIQKQKRMADLSERENENRHKKRRRQRKKNGSSKTTDDVVSSVAENLPQNETATEELKETKTESDEKNQDISQQNSLISGLSLLADYGSDSDDAPEETSSKNKTEGYESDVTNEETSLPVIPVDDVKPDVINTQELEMSITESECTTSKEGGKLDEAGIKEKESDVGKDEKTADLTREREVETIRMPLKCNNNNMRYRRKTNAMYSKGRLRLLHQLLARDIQRERNIISQCIKYIADNNFFDELK